MKGNRVTPTNAGLDLDPIRERSSRYLNLADELADGKLPGMGRGATATTLGLSASLTAADVPDLLAEIDRLRTLVEARNG